MLSMKTNVVSRNRILNRHFLWLLGLLFANPSLLAQKGTIDRSVITTFGGAKKSIDLKISDRKFEELPNFKIESPSVILKLENRNWPLDSMPKFTEPEALKLQINGSKLAIITIKNTNIAKFGIGNYGRTLFNFNTGYAPRENKFLGLYVNHDANQSGSVLNEFSGRSENEVRFSSRSFGKKVFWDSRVSYKENTSAFYGMSDIPKYYTIRDLEIINNRFLVSGNFSNSDKEGKSDYSGSTSFSFFSNQRNESEWVSQSKFQYATDFSPNLIGQIDADFILSELKQVTSLSRQFYRLKPKIQFSGARIALQVGLNIINSNDGLANKSQGSVFPQISIDYAPSDIFHLFGGVGGDVQFNSLSNFSAELPWLGAKNVIKNTSQIGNLFGGIKGTTEKYVDFELKYSYSEFADLPFFINSASQNGAFEVIYVGDEKKVKVVNLTGHFNFKMTEGITTGIKFDAATYNNMILEKPFHRPNLIASWTNSIRLSNKLLLSPDVYIIRGLFARDVKTQKAVALEDIMDLNVKLHYQMNPNTSFHIQGNNLTGKAYQRYLNYSVQGLNFNAGFGYSF
jgi:hypothetical protein